MIIGWPEGGQGLDGDYCEQDFQQVIKGLREEQPIVGERLAELMNSAEHEVSWADFEALTDFVYKRASTFHLCDLGDLRERLPVRLEYLFGWTDQREKEGEPARAAA